MKKVKWRKSREGVIRSLKAHTYQYIADHYSLASKHTSGFLLRSLSLSFFRFFRIPFPQNEKKQNVGMFAKTVQSFTCS